MAKLRILTVSAALALSCMPLVACGGQKVDVTFSDMEVTVERDDGWSGERGAMFEVKGSVTNTSDNPINQDNLPVLVEGDGEQNVASITQDKLLAGETCNVTYTGSVSIEDEDVSTVTFTGKKTFTGLDEVAKELNEGLASVFEQYQAEESELEGAAKRQEQVLEDAQNAKGKTASEALAICEDGKLIYRFEDSLGTDITSAISGAKEGAKILQSKVTAVSVQGTSVVFTLDYTDSMAAKEREQKQTTETGAGTTRQDVEKCAGKTAAEALTIAEAAGMNATFIDSMGLDVTKDVQGGKASAGARQALVAKVRIVDGALSAKPTVIFTLDYTDPATSAQRYNNQELDMERAKRVFEGSVDKTVNQAVALAESEGIPYRLIDSWNEDVTERAMGDEYEGWRSRVIVTAADVSPRNVSLRLNAPLTITAADNAAFADLLSATDPSDGACTSFASKYQGHTIEFDGCVTGVTNHANYNTRFDYTLKAGDYATSGLNGPNFVFEDVSYYDLSPKGDFPDSVEVGLNLHICAEVVRYDSTNGLFYLRPVQTKTR